MYSRTQRHSQRLRLALCGPSGAGKTWSALLLAKGLMQNSGGRIALLDTERGSASLYSRLCEFDSAALAPPFSPERYIEAIRAAEAAGYEVLVIDSLSHAWAGPGGVLEMQDRAAKSLRNSFAAWREVTPEHNALVDALLDSSCHIIATLRSKTAYEVQQDGGRTRVQKVGLAPVQRDGLEYEFTVVLDLAVEGHVATSSKDRTGLFDGKRFVVDETTGAELRHWLQGGRGGFGVCGGQDAHGGNGDDTPGSATQQLHQQLAQAIELLGLAPWREAFETQLCTRHGVARPAELDEKALQQELEVLRDCWRAPRLLEQLKGELAGRQAA